MSQNKLLFIFILAFITFDFHIFFKCLSIFVDIIIISYFTINKIIIFAIRFNFISLLAS